MPRNTITSNRRRAESLSRTLRAKAASDRVIVDRMARAMQVWHIGRKMYPQELVGDNYMKFARIALKEMRAHDKERLAELAV